MTKAYSFGKMPSMNPRHEQGEGIPSYEIRVIKDSPLTLFFRMLYPTILRFDFQRRGGLGFGEAQIPGINDPGVVFHNSSQEPVQIAIKIESGGSKPQRQNVVLKPDQKEDKLVLLPCTTKFHIHLGEYPDKAHSEVDITIQPPAQG